MHYAALLKAELADVGGKTDEAQYLFENALDLAQKRGQINDTAKFEQRYSEFLARQGKTSEAAKHMQVAVRLYDQWGAKALSRQLGIRYPELICPVASVELPPNTTFED